MTIATSHVVAEAASLADADFINPTTGQRWTMVATLDDATFFAETASDLLAAMIPDYPAYVPPATGASEDRIEAAGAEEEKALIIRWDHACHIAHEVQTIHCNDASRLGRFDPADHDEDILTAIFTDKKLPVVGVDYWTLATVPLVLVATHYAPTTHLAPPQGKDGGEVLWLDPSDEMAYLRSLDALGVIGLHVADDLADQPV